MGLAAFGKAYPEHLEIPFRLAFNEIHGLGIGRHGWENERKAAALGGVHAYIAPRGDAFSRANRSAPTFRLLPASML